MYINHKTVAYQYFLNSFLLLFYVIPHDTSIKGLSGRIFHYSFFFHSQINFINLMDSDMHARVGDCGDYT